MWSNRNPHPPPGDPTIVFLGIYPKELKMSVHTKAYTWMFVAALFIIAKNFKQPTCSLIGEYIKKPCISFQTIEIIQH